MANIKSQKKRIITNEKSRMRNRAVKSEIKTAIRHVKDAVAAGDGTAAYAAALAACRLLDKAVSKGVIHKNQAANRKSGIMARQHHRDRCRSRRLRQARREAAGEDRLQEGCCQGCSQGRPWPLLPPRRPSVARLT